MIVRAVKTSLFREGEDLAAFIREHIPKLKNGSIVAITSKVVALAEGRVADARDKEELIKREST